MFWGGGRGTPLPFRVGVSSDSGATWKLWLPNVTNEVTPTPLASPYHTNTMPL